MEHYVPGASLGCFEFLLYYAQSTELAYSPTPNTSFF